MNNSITIIIPAYNETQNIEDVCSRIKNICLQYGWQLLVVDDGSTDDTARIVEKINVEIVKHHENRGYGAALKTGIRHADSKWIMIIDADGTYPIEAIEELAGKIENTDMVVAARTGKNVNIPLIRRPAKWLINILANYLVKRKIPDLNSGLRIFRKELAEKFIKILPNGFSFTTTITLAALSNNYIVDYLPINYKKRQGKSKIRPVYDTLNFVQLILRTVLYFNPLRIFVPLSLILFLSSFSVLILSYIFVGRIHDATTVLLAITGLQILIIGLIADLIDKKL